jgi:putative hemolysin
MEVLITEVFLIAILILLNGYLAGTEIAVVTARRSHIKQLAESGKKNAKIFLKLREEPDRFLATIQIGITTVSVLASAVGGAAAVKVIKPTLQAVPIRIISLGSEPIAIGIVVVIITYFSVIFGELVPKSIALMHPETIGLWTARSIDTFSRMAAIFVKILTFSTSIVLTPFGRKPFTERAYITEEEVKMLIKEGRKHGVFEPTEEKILQSVFEFTDMSVKEVMVPDTWSWFRLTNRLEKLFRSSRKNNFLVILCSERNPMTSGESFMQKTSSLPLQKQDRSVSERSSSPLILSLRR